MTASSTTANTAFDLVQLTRSHEQLDNFGILPSISPAGWSLAARPSPLDSARKLESNGAHFVNLGWIWNFCTLKMQLTGQTSLQQNFYTKKCFLLKLSTMKANKSKVKKRYFLRVPLDSWYWSVVWKVWGCAFHNDGIGKLPRSAAYFSKARWTGSATVKVAFNLVHVVESYGRSKEFGFLPIISAPGPNFALRPSPLILAREFESFGTN